MARAHSAKSDAAKRAGATASDRAGVVKVGLCGFTIKLADYLETFPVVEVQQTFYEPPADRVMQRWRDAAPDSFEFTIKAWQLITHRATSRTYRRLKTVLTDEERAECGAFRPTPTVLRAWERTLACARLLSASSILFQCPASFKPVDENIDNMHAFFAAIERPPDIRLMWEPRGPWPDETVARICRDLELTHVVDPFVNPSLTADVTYWRLHGIGGYYHHYSDEELQRLIASLPRSSRETYVMFNNVPRANDARRFIEMLSVGESS